MLSKIELTLHHISFLNAPEKTALQLLPTDKVMKEIFIMIVSRILTTHIQFSCSDVVTWHKDHKYYKEMSAKSEVICIVWYPCPILGSLGVLLSKGDKMIKILQHLQKYINVLTAYLFPAYNGLFPRLSWIVLGGDQLTVARTRGAQVAMTNAHTPDQKIYGLIPIVLD